jgi:hypothetical protein
MERISAVETLIQKNFSEEIIFSLGYTPDEYEQAKKALMTV